MATDQTKEQIAGVIHSLASGKEQFCTIREIADRAGISRQTVHNHIDDVVEANPEIHSRTVGQTEVYYLYHNRLHELDVEGVETAGELINIEGSAQYFVLKDAPPESDFDFVVQWYDSHLNGMEDYTPSAEEMGEAMTGWGSEPVAIKFYESPVSSDNIDDSQMEA